MPGHFPISLIWNNLRCGTNEVQGHLNFLTSEQPHEQTNGLHFLIFYLNALGKKYLSCQICHVNSKIIENNGKISQLVYVEAPLLAPHAAGIVAP